MNFLLTLVFHLYRLPLFSLVSSALKAIIYGTHFYLPFQNDWKSNAVGKTLWGIVESQYNVFIKVLHPYFPSTKFIAPINGILQYKKSFDSLGWLVVYDNKNILLTCRPGVNWAKKLQSSKIIYCGKITLISPKIFLWKALFETIQTGQCTFITFSFLAQHLVQLSPLDLII